MEVSPRSNQSSQSSAAAKKVPPPSPSTPQPLFRKDAPAVLPHLQRHQKCRRSKVPSGSQTTQSSRAPPAPSPARPAEIFLPPLPCPASRPVEQTAQLSPCFTPG